MEKIEFHEISSGVYKILESSVVGYPEGTYVNADSVITLANAKDVKVEILTINNNWVDIY
jgi:hypothetical protein